MALRPGQRRAPFVGQPRKASIALDQPSPKLFLQRGDAGRQGRLRHVARCRCPGEMPFACDRHEIFE